MYGACSTANPVHIDQTEYTLVPLLHHVTHSSDQAGVKKSQLGQSVHKQATNSSTSVGKALLRCSESRAGMAGLR